MCVGCRKRAPVSELLRVVVEQGPPGSYRIVPDPRRRLPGRGASLHREQECLELAQRRRAFRRALRCQAALDPAPVVEYLAEQARSAQSEQLSRSDVSEAGEPDEQPVKRQR